MLLPSAMKVLHVIPGIAPRYGGPSQAVIQMCQALRSEEVEVLIATTDADGDERLAVEIGRPVVYEGVPTIFFPRQLSEAFKYSHLLARWLDKSVEDFDIVHIHAVFSHSSLAAARACENKNVPYIVRPLGSLDPWSLSQKRFAKRILFGMGVNQMLDGACAIHYTTAAEKQLAEDGLGINSGVVIPLGVNPKLLRGSAENFREHFPELAKSPYVLLLSRLHHKKNIESLLEVFSAVIKEGEQKAWKLVIAGDGERDYIEKLKQLAFEICGDNVIFAGWLDGARKAAALRGAELVVLPSFQENFGLSIVEALACGVPVLISTQVNLSDEIQAAGAGWVVNLEGDSLQWGLTEALRDKRERHARGAAGERLVRSRYTWPAVAKQLKVLYGGLSLASNKDSTP
jgi:glycosyltransferase involved in cell wall biosynthesis